MRMEKTESPAIPTGFEPEWEIEANGQTWRTGTVGMRVSERLAYVKKRLTASLRTQRLIQIGQNILNVLDADGQADEIGCYAGRRQFFLVQL